MLQHSKEYRDKVEDLKVKIFVVINEFMLLQFSGVAKNDKLVATKFLCSDTRHSCRDNN